MKKIIKYSFFITIIIVISSCKDFFEVKNNTSLSAQGYVDNYDKAVGILSEAYSKLGTNNDGIMGSERFMMPTDICEMYGEFQSFTWDPTNNNIKSLWRKLYKLISDINFALSVIDLKAANINATFASSEIESASFISSCLSNPNFSAAYMLAGEARCLRALSYFTLYRYFGGVPIIDKIQGSDISYIPRASRDELFKFIEDDLKFAMAYCETNKNGVLYGRITKASAAALLAKCKVFQGSYIRRANMYSEQIGETSSDVNLDALYAEAITLCDDIIAGKYGSHLLVPYYPNVFTTYNSEMLISFNGLAQKNRGCSYSSTWGVGGNSNYGATGTNSTSLHPIIYDFKMWEYEGKPRTLFQHYGAEFGGSEQWTGHDVYSEFQEAGSYTFTGDSIRRMWNVAKVYITGPTRYNLPAGLWCFEPYGETLGNEFYIEPCKNEANYTQQEKDIIQLAITNKSWNDLRWYNAPNKWSRDLLSVGCFWRFLKFRRPLPQTIDKSTYDGNNLALNIPILRMAEVYLLKAEASYFLNNEKDVINSLNIIRKRARNQSSLRNMYMDNINAPYLYVKNAVPDIPNTITGETLLREILWERCRELCGEDDCRWLDISRFPDLLAETYDDMENYRDPLHHMVWFYNKYISTHFNSKKISRVLFPIPLSEFQYFPNLGQNPGY